MFTRQEECILLGLGGGERRIAQWAFTLTKYGHKRHNRDFPEGKPLSSPFLEAILILKKC